jgi:ATP-dependent Clp protease ATP-binding subunit ClpX
LERNTGARGLRSILESAMTDIMYEIPSRHDVAEVQITPECINGTGKSNYILLRELPAASLPEAE